MSLELIVNRIHFYDVFLGTVLDVFNLVNLIIVNIQSVLIICKQQSDKKNYAKIMRQLNLFIPVADSIARASNAGGHHATIHSDDPAQPLTQFEESVKVPQNLYPTNHLFVLSPSNPIRRFCVYVSTSRAFDNFVLLAIGLNCIMMAIDSPLPSNDKTKINFIVESMEIYLLGIFIGEAILKIVAQGLILHEYSYLRNSWNLLDFTVVVTGILGMKQIGLDAGEPMKVIKAARVLRPLKLVSGVPSLQVVMSAMLRSMASLLQICLLIGFVILMYGIVGLSFLIGKFHVSCFYKNTTSAFVFFLINHNHYHRHHYYHEKLCVHFPSWIKLNSIVMYLQDDNPILCGKRQCPEPNLECKEYWNGPNDGVTNFDNILSACLTVFVCITCEGWTETMYRTFDAIDPDGYYMWLYYYSLNVIGSQFMLNLVCGVLAGEFSSERDRVARRAIILNERSKLRQEEKYRTWMDVGEVQKLRDTEKLQHEDIRNDDEDEHDEIVPPPATLTYFQRLKLRNNIIRVKLRTVMTSTFIYWTVIVLVFLNSLSGAIQHYRQPQWITDVIVITDWIFLGCFFTEMILKIYSLGHREYFKSKFNIFDCVVVIGGLCNLLLSKVFNINLGIPVLRQLRLMRLFRYTRYWGAMKNLAKSILESLPSILSLLVLLFLFIMIFALLGMQLFGGFFRTSSRTNFNDFFNAMLAVFQIITGEDWNVVMYEGVVSSGGARTAKGLAVSLYFIGITILGNYMLLNVFLAIAVDNLTMTEEEEKIIENEENERERNLKEIQNQYNDQTIELHQSHTISSQRSVMSHDDETDGGGEFGTAIEGGTMKPGEDFLENLKNPGRMTGNFFVGIGLPILEENTLFILKPTNPIRKYIHKLVSAQWFDNIILALIVISSALLAAENTTHPNAKINEVLTYLDYLFTTIFALEVVLKVVNYGLVLHQHSYCRDGWNCVDMFVVFCAIASLVLSQNENILSKNQTSLKSVVKILRILRVLRPLKSINKLPKLKAVFQCMIYSLKNVINIMIVMLQFMFIFSVMGVQLFMGKLYYCNDASKEFQDQCQGYYITFTDENYNRPKEESRQWKVYEFNFDNIFNAMLTLFASSTGEGWPAVMQTGIDSQEINQGPLLNNKIWNSLYFVIFVIVMSFFFINVFVGLIILTFKEQGASEEGEILNRNASNCLLFAMHSRPIERFMPKNTKGWKYKTWELIESVPWEMTVMTLIVLNTIVLMIEFHDQPKTYENIIGEINHVFTFAFTIEFLVKLFALGRNYFRDGWNNFDLLIVLGSILDFLIKKVLPPNTIDFDPSIFRLFRAARLVKLLRRSRSLRILLWTFLQSFKALPYVGMLIFLVFFIYGVVGMQIFSLISIDNKEEPWKQINRNNNFRSYFAATQVLFRIATGENWPNVMLACTSKAECDSSLPAVEELKTCGSDVSYLFFISFIFLCSFLMLNLFIAVIMDSFAFLTEDSSILGPHHLDEFVTVWSEFDPRASGRIKHTEVCDLLRKMLPPIGLGNRCPKISAYKRLVEMNMTLYKDGTVDYRATFFALVRTGLQLYTENANIKSNDQKFRKLLRDRWPNISKRTLDLVIPKVPRNSKHMTVGKIYAAKLIWEKYKYLVKSGKLKNKTVKKPFIIKTPLTDRSYLSSLNDQRQSSAIDSEEEFSYSSSVNKQHQSSFRESQLPSTARSQLVTSKSYPASSVTSQPFITAKSSNPLAFSIPSSSQQSTPMMPLKPLSHLRSSTENTPNRLTPSTPGSNSYSPDVGKKQVALAIRHGHNPYRLYGLSEEGKRDDWC